MRLQAALVVPLLFALSGCATEETRTKPAPHYTKAGATQDQFLKDRYACIQETQHRESNAAVNGYGAGAYQSTMIPSCGDLASCLAAKGYIQADEGELVIPKGAEVRCRR